MAEALTMLHSLFRYSLISLQRFLATVLSAQLIRALTARCRVSYQKIHHIFSYYPVFIGGGREAGVGRKKDREKEKELQIPSLERQQGRRLV